MIYLPAPTRLRTTSWAGWNSKAGLAARDRMVLEYCRGALPVAITMAAAVRATCRHGRYSFRDGAVSVRAQRG